jgi:hypothetical protein
MQVSNHREAVGYPRIFRCGRCMAGGTDGAVPPAAASTESRRPTLSASQCRALDTLAPTPLRFMKPGRAQREHRDKLKASAFVSAVYGGAVDGRRVSRAGHDRYGLQSLSSRRRRDKSTPIQAVGLRDDGALAQTATRGSVGGRWSLAPLGLPGSRDLVDAVPPQSLGRCFENEGIFVDSLNAMPALVF